MNRTELREKLNKIDFENCNQYDLVNLFESVKLSNEDLNRLSEMVEDKDIHDFLYSKLNIVEGGWYGSPRQKEYYYEAEYHLPDYFYSQTEYDIPDGEIDDDDVEGSIQKYLAKKEGREDDKEYIDGIEVLSIRKYDEDGDYVDESLRIEESMSSAVERQTLGYKKTKGQIQCNGGEQAEEVEDLLKAKYDNVTTQKGKGGKVIIKFSKNESLGEDFYDDEYDDFELASIYGGDFTYCPVCGARMEYEEDGDHYCPKCKKSGHTLSLIRRGLIKGDNESLSEAFDMNSVEFKDASADEDAMYGIEKHKNENRYFAVAVNNKTHESIMSQNSYDLGWSMRQVLKSVRANLHYDEGSIDDWSFYKYTNEDVSPIVIDKTFFNYKGYTIEPGNNEWEITSPDGKKDYVPIDPADEDGGWEKAKEFVDGIVGKLEEDTIEQKSKNESVDPNTLSDDYVLLDSKAENQTDKDTDLYYDCIKEFCMIDEIDYEDMEVTFITNQRDADDWDEETFKTDYTYKPDDEEVALECANDYLVKKYPDKITVGDIKKSADDVYNEVKDFFYEQAQKEAEEAFTLSDFQEQLKEDKAKETMKSVAAKWRSRRSNKSESVEDDNSKEKKDSKNIAGIEHL